MITFFVLALQFLIGWAVVHRLAPELPRLSRLGPASLIGLPLESVLLVVMDLIGLPLTLGGFLVLSMILFAVLWGRQTGQMTAELARLFTHPPRLRPADWVFAVLFLYLVGLSAWETLRLPVMARDAIVGMDLVAKQAVEERTLVSRVFTGPELRGQLSNQPFYAPFVTSMQIIFRLTGLAFGKIWLSALLGSFGIFAYSRLRRSLPPVVAGLLLLLLVSAPSFYSLTWFVLTDFPVAVFVGLTALFFREALVEGRTGRVILSALFMGFACWTRTDSAVLIPPALVFLAVATRFGRPTPSGSRVPTWRWIGLFALLPGALLAIWPGLYFRFRFADAPSGDLQWSCRWSELGQTLGDMMALFGAWPLYGMVFGVFALGLLGNAFYFRSSRGWELLVWVTIVFGGLVVVTHLVPAATVPFTVKRGYLKLLPIMVFYLGECELMRRLGELRALR